MTNLLPLLRRVLLGEKSSPPPLWIMRQAGRYLPDYREVRQKFSDFMEFCLTPEAVTQVTLQPIERFDFDAAIIFCDILIIPHLLGQTVRFVEGHGPQLVSVEWKSFLEKAQQQSIVPALEPVFQAIRSTRQALPASKSLLGFCGSPWTIACYMLQGSKIGDGLKKDWPPSLVQELLNVIQQHAVDLLLGQIEAGCDVIQIFDSWAALVPVEKRAEYLWKPLAFIFNAVKKVHPDLPIIYYGRGVSDAYPFLSQRFENICFGLDQSVDPLWAVKNIPNNIPLQGNLDPLLLIEGQFQKQTEKILQTFAERPFVFNLGHGILPQTPLESVYHLVDQVRNFKN